jgi:hypothetical protein
MSSPSIPKALAVAGVIVASEMFFFKDSSDIQTLAIYGGAIGTASYVATYISPMIIPSSSPVDLSSYGIDTKTAEARLVEFGLSLGISALLHDKLLVGYDFRQPKKIQRLLAIGVADVIGEYVDDYLNGRALSYLK